MAKFAIFDYTIPSAKHILAAQLSERLERHHFTWEMLGMSGPWFITRFCHQCGKPTAIAAAALKPHGTLLKGAEAPRHFGEGNAHLLKLLVSLLAMQKDFFDTCS